MKNSKIWMLALAVLAVVWAVVAAVMHVTDSQTSSPEKVIGLMGTAPWLENASVGEKARHEHLEEVITKLNMLGFDERRQMREDGQEIVDRFFASLKPDEQKEFVNRTVERHFQAVMKGLNAMKPDERKQMVDRIRRDMKQQRGDGAQGRRLQEQDEEVYEEIVSKGIESYYRDASAATKMDLAPILEDFQSRMQRPGGR